MSCIDHNESLNDCLALFAPTRYEVTRSLALYSAAITDSSDKNLRAATGVCLGHHATPEQLYEIVLQSHLFLGFPRMLIAAEALTASVPNGSLVLQPAELSDDTLTTWLEQGQNLCRRIYDSSYDALKTRVQGIAPEIFLWMELEGYGKVLSRPGLDIIDREMAIVACLMMENRVSQLHSHLRGALNVGAEPQLVRDVISDLSPASPEGHATAINILNQLGIG
ncbi:MAG: carboxymuconolactone decarboxylase family protein [candidate division Zixibacteria bacterium]|nr:carboxymuconolactone decarboxylase family protein [candidate division Zixibacteria bacterium]